MSRKNNKLNARSSIFFFFALCTRGTKVAANERRAAQLKKRLFIIYLSIRKQLDVMIAICLINELIKTVKCLQSGLKRAHTHTHRGARASKYFQKTGRGVPSQPCVNFN